MWEKADILLLEKEKDIKKKKKKFKMDWKSKGRRGTLSQSGEMTWVWNVVSMLSKRTADTWALSKLYKYYCLSEKDEL